MANVSTGHVVYSNNPEVGKRMPKRMEQIVLDYVQTLENGDWKAIVPFIKIGNDRKFLRRNVIVELAAMVKAQ